jgi:hypothetical protein
MSASQRTNVLSQDTIKQTWSYEKGHLYWLISKPGVGYGKQAGCLCPNGYIRIGYNNKVYAAHNLIWIFHNGDIPIDKEIDHIDYNRSNNLINNLRLLSTSENLLLRTHVKYPKGTIYFQKPNNKWRTQIVVNGKRTELGLYETREKAEQVLEEHRISLGFPAGNL